MSLKLFPLSLLTLFSIVVAGGPSYAETLTCKQILQATSHDRHYLQVKHSNLDAAQKATRITTLLNRVFFPMMKSFESTIKAMPPSEILTEFANSKNSYALTQSYFAHSPSLTSKPNYAIVSDPAVQRTITYNAGQASEAYKAHTRDDVVSHREMLYAHYPQPRTAQFPGELSKMFNITITPVGEYGPEFAQNMIQTTQLISSIAERRLQEVSKDLMEKNKNILSGETARGKNHVQEGTPAELAPLLSFSEGLMTFHQLVNLMLSERIPGIATGEEALHAFIFNGEGKMGLTSMTTSRLPLGVTGPMTLSGLGFKNALYINGEGKLALTDQVKNAFADFNKIASEKGRQRKVCPMASFFRGFTKAADPHKEADPTQFTPDTTDRAGLQILAETYWQVFKVVAAQNKAGGSDASLAATMKASTAAKAKPSLKTLVQDKFLKKPPQPDGNKTLIEKVWEYLTHN